MKHILFFPGLILLITLACNAPLEELAATPLVLPTPIPLTTPIPVSDSATVASPRVTAVPTTQPTIAPTATVATTRQPTFTNLRFAAQPDGNSATIFPAGSTDVYALWDYRDLAEGDVMRRVWFYNGEMWIDREIVWDVTKYGREGTVSDVHIYEYESDGLLAGDYRVEIYLNNVLQMTSTFQIKSISEQAASFQPVRVENNSRLILEDSNGSQQAIEATHEIIDITLFPDGQHLLYVEKIPESEVNDGGPPAPRHLLHVVNLTTGQTWPLSLAEENLHTPRLAEDGRALTLIAGTGLTDACGYDRRLTIMTLDEQKQRTALHKMSDFDGIPTNEHYWFFPVNEGQWHTTTTVDAHINAYCLTESMGASDSDIALAGIYRFDLTTLTARKIAESPSW